MPTWGGISSSGAVSMSTINSEFGEGNDASTYRSSEVRWIQSNKQGTISGAGSPLNWGFFRGKGKYAYYSITSGTYTFPTNTVCALPPAWTLPFTATGFCNHGFLSGSNTPISFGSVSYSTITRYPSGTWGVRGFFKNNSNNKYCVILDGASPGPPSNSIFVWSTLFLYYGQYTVVNTRTIGTSVAKCFLLDLALSSTVPSQIGIDYT